MEIYYCDLCRARVTQGELDSLDAVQVHDRYFCPSCVQQRDELKKVRAELATRSESQPGDRMQPAGAPLRRRRTTGAHSRTRVKNGTLAVGLTAGVGVGVVIVLSLAGVIGSDGDPGPRRRIHSIHRGGMTYVMSTSPRADATAAGIEEVLGVRPGPGEVSPGVDHGAAADSEHVHVGEPAGAGSDLARRSEDHDESVPDDSTGSQSASAAGRPEVLSEADAAVRRGMSLARAGDSAGAEDAFREAVRIEPDHAIAHSDLGALLLERGQWDDADAHLTRALETDPELPEAHLNLGLLRRAQWRDEEAGRLIAEGLRLAPEHADEVGRTLDVVDQERIAALEEDGPQNAAQALFLSYRACDSGKWDEALEHARKAVSFDPDSSEAHYLVGIVHDHKGDRLQAVGAYLRATAADPDHFQALNNTAWIYATETRPPLRNPEAAIRYAERAREACGEESAVILDTLARSYHAAGRTDAALTHARRAHDLAPDDVEIAAFLEELESVGQ